MYNCRLGLEYFMQKNQILMGRMSTAARVDVPMGPDPAISREHARIYYNGTNEGFIVEALGSNGMYVGLKYLAKGERVSVQEKIALKAGNFSCIFDCSPEAADDSDSSMFGAFVDAVEEDKIKLKEVSRRESRNEPKHNFR
ncbi:hypothetical protein AAMO2058_000156800 [Amorphochlora amoebiformis]|uniref:FHA domain-containing protein n=2 Tax=Amorphochlora amoebiformis TaxID=1561963 RepID=A0A7S0DFQ0_9EUKA|mmetsp:Transcript_26234/g.41481  ORF Transcript_26234/g.41481 Transcript_26234/m.41481 type:complete len:141 (+) Transcript_26234:184-606(+)